MLTLTTAPASEPLSLADVKFHLREDDDAQDSFIESLIVVARRKVEELTGRALITQTWRLDLPHFPCGGRWSQIVLPRPKLISVTSVKYYDTSGTLQTMDVGDYVVHLGGEYGPGFIVPAYGESWPSARDLPNAVQVVFVAGYGTAEQVPEPIGQYMKLLIGSMYENREADAEKAVTRLGFVESLIDDYRMYAF